MLVNNLLLVYGTLRSGMGNHPLMGGCSEVGVATIKARLHLAGWLPMIFEGEGKVVGEIYEIPDAETWRQLDSLEGHPNWYERREVDADLNGKTVKVWAYFMTGDPREGTYVESGDYVKARAEDRRW